MARLQTCSAFRASPEAPAMRAEQSVSASSVKTFSTRPAINRSTRMALSCTRSYGVKFTRRTPRRLATRGRSRSGKSMVFAIAASTKRAPGMESQSKSRYSTVCACVTRQSTSSSRRTTVCRGRCPPAFLGASSELAAASASEKCCVSAACACPSESWPLPRQARATAGIFRQSSAKTAPGALRHMALMWTKVKRVLHRSLPDFSRCTASSNEAVFPVPGMPDT
mmetsp:Transcript_120915/g.301703  ORF Transcript_120915/g.301703 Transcript_120915/m.301703 type:complete len:224 (-) Transcript_120915:925-1596(-)